MDEIEQDVDLNNDEDIEVDDTEDTSKEKPKADKPKETPQQKKARLERQLKQVRKQLGESDEEPAPKLKEEKKEPSELDYGQKAFLKASGINGSDELALVREFIKRTGEPIDVIVEDDIFQARLQKLRDTKANEAAADGAPGRGNGGSAKDTPEYWLAKLGPTDQVPSDLPRELREKIVKARFSKNGNQRMFYNDN